MFSHYFISGLLIVFLIWFFYRFIAKSILVALFPTLFVKFEEKEIGKEGGESSEVEIDE